MSRTSELSLLLRCEYSLLNMYGNRIRQGTATKRDYRLYESSSRAIFHFKEACEAELEPIHYPSEYHYPDPTEPEIKPIQKPQGKPKKARRTATITVGEQLTLFAL